MSNATERAYLYVREQILSGRYPAASHLKEEHIAEEAQVSRTPVREALRRLSTDTTLRRSLGAAGRAFVTERFTEERLLEAIERLYRELTGHLRNPVTTDKMNTLGVRHLEVDPKEK